LNGFRKSFSPHNRQLIILISNSKEKVDDFAFPRDAVQAGPDPVNILRGKGIKLKLSGNAGY
jgi:hypothetical protein